MDVCIKTDKSPLVFCCTENMLPNLYCSQGKYRRPAQRRYLMLEILGSNN